MSRTAASPVLPDGVSRRGDLLGALNATASMLPFVLSYGFIAFGALGAAAAQLGLTAAVIAVVLGGAAMALFGASRLPSASPSASSCLIVSGAVLALAQDPVLTPTSPGGTALLLAGIALVVVSAGVLIMLLGAFGAGSLVRYVPQPVLAGLMNGVAILLVVSQLPPLLGLPTGALARDGLAAVAGWRVTELGIGLATAVLMALAARRWKRAPAPFLALFVAGAAVAFWQANAAAGSAGATLQRIGPLGTSLPWPDVLRPLGQPSQWQALARHAPALVVATLLLTVIGALESVLNFMTVQQQIDERADPDRELLAIGAANIVSGLFGGLPLVCMRLRALATWNGGGRSRVSIVLGSAFLALVFTLGLPLIERLSTAVVAGIVVMLAWTLVDLWTLQLAARWWRGDRSADLRRSLVIVGLVSAVMVAWGLAAGVVAGVAVSALIFIRTLNRQLVRARYTAADFPSRRVHAPDEEALLAPLRCRIEVFELEGALFFGSADRLQQEALQVPAATRDVVVDLRRVSTVDASGAMALAQLGVRLARLGMRLRLAGVRPDDRHGAALQAHGIALATRDEPSSGAAATPAAVSLHAYPDVDRAIEAAELRALDDAAGGRGPRAVALADCRLLQGLDAVQLAAMAPHLRAQELGAGDRLFAEGDPGVALYLLTEGSISIVDASRGQRFATLSPGMCFGETALLDGGGRTAAAVADTASVVHALSREALDQLRRSDPDVSAQLYLNLARHLSERLRSASAGWRRAAD